MFGLNAFGYNVIFRDGKAVWASIKPLKQINKQINKMKKECPGEYTIEKIEGWLTK